MVVADLGDLEPRSWDWQSVAPCREVAELAAAGADDDALLAAAGRYASENLFLNATHEIGVVALRRLAELPGSRSGDRTARSRSQVGRRATEACA